MTPRSRGITTRKSAATFAQKVFGLTTRLFGVAQIEAAKPAEKRFLTDDEIAAVAALRSHARQVAALLGRPLGQAKAETNGSTDDASSE
jgi:hypothetical protein